jgi:hypothetical protein
MFFIGWDKLNTGTLQIDWAIITSIAALTIAIVAILIVIIENRRSKFLFGLKVLMEVNDYFHSGSMLETRQKAAASLLNDSYDDDVENLLDFFEMVGYLSKRRAIKKEFIWNNISYWIIRYWYAAKGYIEKEQQKIPKRWDNMTSLFRYLSKMERKKYGVTIITQESIKVFLEKESGNLNK